MSHPHCRTHRALTCTLLAAAVAATSCAETERSPLPTEVTANAQASEAPAVSLENSDAAGAMAAPEGGPQVASTGDAVTLDFEGFADWAVIGSAYESHGVVFTAGHVLNQHGDLNYSYYPTRSGVGLAGNVNGDRVAMQFAAPVQRAGGYVTAYFPAAFTCYRADGSVVGSVSVPTPNLANWAGAVAPPNYPAFVEGSGIRSCALVGTPNFFSLDDFTFVQGDPLRIVEVEAALPDSSFTTRDGENVVRLRAAVSDPDRSADVQWRVEDFDGDQVDSGAPTPPEAGASTTLVIDPDLGDPHIRGTPRWRAVPHPGAMDEKRLTYRIRAYYVDQTPEGPDTTWSQAVVLRQHDADVLRQEYIDFTLPVPDRGVLIGHAPTRHFGLGELLRRSDYIDLEIGWLERSMKDGLDATRDHFGGPLATSSVYRNPVHNSWHLGGTQGAQRSSHMFGNAADLPTGGDEDRFYAIARAANLASGCLAPPQEWLTRNQIRASYSIRNWSHVHADWSAGCPATWSQWAADELSGARMRAAAPRTSDAGNPEDALLSTDFAERAGAVLHLSMSPGEISPAGRARLIELLGRELDGTIPTDPADLGEEAYAEHMLRLTALVVRLRDGRATAPLARQGIAVSTGARFQLAAAGDAGVALLAAQWDREGLRAAIVRTLGLAMEYARLESSPLARESRIAIREYLLRAADAEDPWLRHAFVDAVEHAADPTYLPLIDRIALTDGAVIDGRRYVAEHAERIAPALRAALAEAPTAALMERLGEAIEAFCRVDADTGPRRGVCRAATNRWSAADRHLASGRTAEAREVLLELRTHLDAALDAGAISAAEHALLAGAATQIVERL